MAKEYTLAGLKIQSPLISAAGVMNGTDLDDITARFERALKTNLGTITLGSFTIPPRAGNEAQFGSPVYYYDKKKGKTYNSMGLANIGMHYALQLLPLFTKKARNKGKVVIFSVSRSIEEQYGDAVEQTLELVKHFLEAGADLVEVNLSTPNTVTKDGGRAPIMGFDLKTVEEVVEGLIKIGNTKKVGLKMPPYLSKEEQILIPKMAKLLARLKFKGFLTICNTIPNQIPRDKKGKPILSVPEGKAGMSGPATKAEGRRQLKMWRDAVGDSIDIVSMLGVATGEEAKKRFEMGATAVGGVTFLRESDDWVTAVDELLSKWQ